MGPQKPHLHPRPEDSESTASRPICAVNRSAAQLVPWWGTTWESWVLWFCLPSGLGARAAPARGGLVGLGWAYLSSSSREATCGRDDYRTPITTESRRRASLRWSILLLLHYRDLT